MSGVLVGFDNSIFGVNRADLSVSDSAPTPVKVIRAKTYCFVARKYDVVIYDHSVCWRWCHEHCKGNISYFPNINLMTVH